MLNINDNLNNEENIQNFTQNDFDINNVITADINVLKNKSYFVDKFLETNLRYGRSTF